ncbi:L-lactate permease [Halolactibacillus alkaliphilus]|uniref:L-lactate permease n=1 Tax=Halolactibacillus alkaliphilus TaxID=442899 RepID=A0A511WX29_9BACI|nr:L-lactate permease [Halolactibacillus alkaliphilus]GEN55669.1 L-lactate permease [Halolactibacillus alkaliphilus]GGN63509.1 L-lactate permease [Halolactibacillus alkaliphilus]SFO62978.1 lactate permease [Halolactibacillus alkaliphilus]
MNNYVLFVLALIPIVFLILALGVFNRPAYKAGLWSVLIASGLAFFFFDMTPIGIVTAILEGAALGIWPIMIVIIAAIFTYNLAQHTKSMDTINKMLSSITTDKRIQVLILAWGFGGFLEAVAGYGTAVALPASILAALGFNPLFAAIISLVANTVPTAFGAVGIPVSTLAQVTGLDVTTLSYMIVLQLTPFIIIIPFLLVVMTGRSFKALKGVVGITLASGIAFAVPQIFVAQYLGAELPALVGSLFSMAVTISMALIFHKDKKAKEPDVVSLTEGVKAWLPYILILVFILLTSPLFPAIYDFVSQIQTTMTIYQGPGATASTFKWIGTPGVLIIFAAVIGSLIQGATVKDIVKVFIQTVKQLSKSALTVVAIVALAKIMGYSGMITAIATVFVLATGSFYPFFAPMLGTLGTFVTGSDTSSNILFGPLQIEVANSIGVNDYWLAAANTSGATGGKMISPQSIAVATSATGLIGQEGKIFTSTLKFCLGYVVFLGILVYVGSLFI